MRDHRSCILSHLQLACSTLAIACMVTAPSHFARERDLAERRAVSGQGEQESAVEEAEVGEFSGSADADRFTFVRVQYDSIGGYGESWYHYEGRDWERWETDYPRGELNLLFRLHQLTSFRVSPQPITLRLTDPSLHDYPFLFMSDVGWQQLSPDEARALARYLHSGGFLWVDDFWGHAEWRNLVENMRRVDESLQWRELAANHPVLTCVYHLERCPQIPARIFYDPLRGNTTDPPSIHRQPSGGLAGMRQVHLMGLYDTRGRLCGIATHNTDIADGWEREGEDREFFLRFSIDAYALTINIITYAMTH